MSLNKFDDVGCNWGRRDGYFHNFGDYSLFICPMTGNPIESCRGCRRDYYGRKREQEIRDDPNNYQEWLRRHNNERT